MQITAKSKHETLANRLADILTQLNSRYRLDPAQLAIDYNTHLRTIKRDFNRFEACNIPLHKEGKFYFLDPKYLGQISFKDIKTFSQISGIHHLIFVTHNCIFSEENMKKRLNRFLKFRHLILKTSKV